MKNKDPILNIDYAKKVEFPEQIKISFEYCCSMTSDENNKGQKENPLGCAGEGKLD